LRIQKTTTLFHLSQTLLVLIAKPPIVHGGKAEATNSRSSGDVRCILALNIPPWVELAVEVIIIVGTLADGPGASNMLGALPDELREVIRVTRIADAVAWGFGHPRVDAVLSRSGEGWVGIRGPEVVDIFAVFALHVAR